MKKLLATLAVISLLAAVAALPAGGASRAGDEEPPMVKVADNKFKSGTLKITKKVATVPKKTLVRFEWVGDNTHNVVGLVDRKKVFSSGDFDNAGHVYRRRFKRDTTIICDIHPDTMKFKIKIEDD